jgi:Ribosomal protein L7/L12 C-terminal domain
MNQPNEQQRQAVNEAIFEGRKIEAIKLHREATGCQLAEAKKAVEEFEKELRLKQPDRFSLRTGKSGCLSVVAAIVLLVSLAATIYLLRS